MLITNLYPPQELGGYGRCMADFVWGLRNLGHSVKILCSNAPYLGEIQQENEYEINRNLLLKGSFKNGVSHITDLEKRNEIDIHNCKVINKLFINEHFDGILIGNIDLIEHEILETVTNINIPIIHHIGFTNPPFNSIHLPTRKNYIIASASYAVKDALIAENFAKSDSPVIYPGARIDLFGEDVTKRKLPSAPDGSKDNPLCIAYAGLLMATKGLHTLIEAIIKLKYKGIYTRTYIAGAEFQSKYKMEIESFLEEHQSIDSVFFTGCLNRSQLARLMSLNHIFVFPSIYPEAFGIVQAEAMASGLGIISSGVGGSKELIESGKNGWLFDKGNSDDLTNKLNDLTKNPKLINKFGQRSKQLVREKFSTIESCKRLEQLFKYN